MYFLKGRDLLSGSPSLVLRNAKPVGKMNGVPGSGFWEIFKSNSSWYHWRWGPPVLLPRPNACRVMDYLPLSRLHGRYSQWFMHSGWKILPADRGECSSCVLQQRPAGIEPGSQSVNPMYCKEKIKGSVGTKWLFKSFQLLYVCRNRE